MAGEALKAALELIWQRNGVSQPHHVACYMDAETMKKSGRYDPVQIEQAENYGAGAVFPNGRGKRYPVPEPYKVKWPKP
jgi:hypothetical protein